MESKVFSLKLDEKLIDLVSCNPVLYDMNRKNYKDTMVKHNVWKKIAETLNLDVPGGNRDQKQRLSLNKTFPMNSAIRRNLGGPLSEVFFANLSTVSQDQVGYTQKLSGPGRDVWVSPSDILMGKVVLKPPFTNRLKLARTHHWILEVGGRFLEQIAKIYEQELQQALEEKERILSEEARLAIQNAVSDNRKLMIEKNKEATAQAINNLKEAFNGVMTDVMNYMLEECHNKFKEELKNTVDYLSEQLHNAVKVREEYVRREYEFQLEWQANICFEEYEHKLKQSQKEWLRLFNEAEDKFESDLAKMKAAMESEQINLLLQLHHKHLWDCQASMRELELIFKNWYMKAFKKEIVSRDYTIIDLENSLSSKTKQISKNNSKIKDIFTQFQKFINFALKEKPGQAEFLLSLQMLLKEDWTDVCKNSIVSQEEVLTESALIVKSILEHTLRTIFNHKEYEDLLFGQKQEEKQTENCAQEIEMERIANRALKVIGESKSSAGSIREFQERRLESLKMIFKRHPSLGTFCDSPLPNTPSDKSLNSHSSK